MRIKDLLFEQADFVTVNRRLNPRLWDKDVLKPEIKKQLIKIAEVFEEFIGIDISKQFQNSDFGGELTPNQLKYCANDVIYLHKIHEGLNKILERENRIKLYYDCLKFLKTRVDLDLALFRDDIWSH